MQHRRDAENEMTIEQSLLTTTHSGRHTTRAHAAASAPDVLGRKRETDRKHAQTKRGLSQVAVRGDRKPWPSIQRGRAIDPQRCARD
eukprot:1957063-Prymnesium_polylepis.1